MQEWLSYNGIKKNGLRKLWDISREFLRSSDGEGSGFVLRPEADFPGGGNQTSFLQKVRQGDAGDVGLAFEKFSSYQALCFFCGSEMPVDDDCGCGQGVETGLEDGQRIRQAVHARTTSANRDACATCDRDRRDLDSEGAHLPNSGERFNPQKSNLVWRRRSFRREHGFVLPGSRPRKDGQGTAGGHGHVESFREVCQEERASCGDSLRQVSCDPPSGRGVRQNTKTGICTTVGARQKLHQGPEIYPALAQRESDAGWSCELAKITAGQQAAEHCVCIEGILWPALGLPDRGLEQAILQQLE